MSSGNSSQHNQQQPPNQEQPALYQSISYAEIDAARQQNQLKIQQLQHALEACQQQELQFKAVQEQQMQQHAYDRQSAIRQVQQQLQYQQHAYDQAIALQRQQHLAAAQQQHQMNLMGNPQLRGLIQEQAQEMRRLSMEAMMRQNPQGENSPQDSSGSR